MNTLYRQAYGSPISTKSRDWTDGQSGQTCMVQTLNAASVGPHNTYETTDE